jgi:hypothetical protein
MRLDGASYDMWKTASPYDDKEDGPEVDCPNPECESMMTFMTEYCSVDEIYEMECEDCGRTFKYDPMAQ